MAARVERPQPLTAEQARAAAAREELELVPADTRSGFKGVSRGGRKFKADIWKGGKQRFLGTFDTPEEAALAYARHVGENRAAAKAAAARVERPLPLTAEQARAVAVREGLELVSADTPSGFKGVARMGGKFVTRVIEAGKHRHLGCFAFADRGSEDGRAAEVIHVRQPHDSST